VDRETRLKRLQWRAHHRGTREADMLVGGFLDAKCANWNDEEISWFEALMDEQDVDILAWAMGSAAVPVRLEGAMMAAMQRLDYISVA
jgi:antitoxin CptB